MTKHRLSFSKYIFICFLFILAIGTQSCHHTITPTTTVILVRHAERNSGVDTLNTAGYERAEELARVLYDSNISAIYASTTNRAQETAAPLAKRLNITPLIYNTNDLPSLIDEIHNIHSGKTILIVGHSNITPETINLLGVTPPLEHLHHDDYDNLFVVSIDNKNNARLLKMQYGLVTP